MKYLTFAGFIAAVACTAPRQNMKPSPKQSTTPDGPGFELVLHNRNYLDVNVFVQHDGQSSRIGTVTGSSSTALDVPRWMIGKDGLVRLVAEPIGDNSRYVTDNLQVQPGQLVELNVENAIARSNYSVQ